MFDPPLDLTGVTGMRFTCGYDNWRDVNVGWGIGDQEMCVMLGLAEIEDHVGRVGHRRDQAVGMTDGVVEYEGPCGILAVPKNPEQTLPTQAERDGPLYMPAQRRLRDPAGARRASITIPGSPRRSSRRSATSPRPCSARRARSTPATGRRPPWPVSTSKRPTCSPSCSTTRSSATRGRALVEPGDPDSSWLYQIMANCAPDGGGSGTHMPLNAPVLLDDTHVALVREWIADGAMP